MAAEIYDEEVIERFLNFEKRSTTHFKDFFDRIKEDRRFLAGEHFDETDDDILGNKRYKAPVDVISNQIRSTIGRRKKVSVREHPLVVNEPSRCYARNMARIIFLDKRKKNIVVSRLLVLKQVVSFPYITRKPPKSESSGPQKKEQHF